MSSIFTAIFLFLSVIVSAYPQYPTGTFLVLNSTPPYPNITTSPTVQNLSSTPSISSYEIPLSTNNSQPSPSNYSQTTCPTPYPSQAYTVMPSFQSIYSPAYQSSFPTNTFHSSESVYFSPISSTPSNGQYSSAYLTQPYNSLYPQYTSSYISTYSSYLQGSYCSYCTSTASVSSPCPLPTGLNVGNPGIFELWSYAPGICDLDNRPVSSSVNSPYTGGPTSYYFVDNSISPPVIQASKGDLWALSCPSNKTAPQAYLRPTHGTPEYYLLFGNPNLDPTPALTLHDNFFLVPGAGSASDKAFLSYLGETWLACPGGKNSYTGLTEYNVYWNPPGPVGDCVQFMIEARSVPRVCTFS